MNVLNYSVAQKWGMDKMGFVLKNICIEEINNKQEETYINKKMLRFYNHSNELKLNAAAKEGTIRPTDSSTNNNDCFGC